VLDQLWGRSYSWLMTNGDSDIETTVGSENLDRDTPIPTLMRAARGAYAQAIRAELLAAGIEDLPRNGPGILFATISTEGGSGEQATSLSGRLGVSKQAISQLVETLVRRGLLVRKDDPEDGRRVDLAVTERGHEAVDAIVRGADSVDEELAGTVSEPELLAFRKALTALAQIKSERIRRGTSKRRPRTGRARFEPILPVGDLSAALEHYEGLGFKTDSFDADYGFANWRGLSIHLAVRPGHDPATNQTSAYLQVPNAGAVEAAWSKAGLGGVTRPVEETPWGMLEGSHTDPDGNVIRFGSPLAE
jgi:DNA-binding MarR family transcriptional regulator